MRVKLPHSGYQHGWFLFRKGYFYDDNNDSTFGNYSMINPLKRISFAHLENFFMCILLSVSFVSTISSLFHLCIKRNTSIVKMEGSRVNVVAFSFSSPFLWDGFVAVCVQRNLLTDKQTALSLEDTIQVQSVYTILLLLSSFDRIMTQDSIHLIAPEASNFK